MERFFLRLQVSVIWHVEDEMVWVGTKEGIFSVKQLYNELEPERLVNFPTKVIWKSCTPPKVGSLCLGGILEQNFNHEHCPKERQSDGKQMLSLW